MDIEQWYTSVPIVTRCYITLAFLLSLAVTYEFVTPLNLYLSFRLIFEKGEWWRFITAFAYFDRFGINLFFHLQFLYFCSRRLEEHFYLRRSAEYLCMLLVGAAAMCGLSIWVDMPFLSYSFTIMILYLWSRRYPEESLQIYWLFTVKAPAFPYVMLVISYLLGSWYNALLDLLGIAVGHTLWFILDVTPKFTGIEFRAPAFIAGLF